MDDPRLTAEMTVATAPWFGSCERCAEPKSELGTHAAETVGRLIPNDGCFGWLCMKHLAEVVHESVLALFPHREGEVQC